MAQICDVTLPGRLGANPLELASGEINVQLPEDVHAEREPVA